MKRNLFILLVMALLSSPLMTLAQHGNSYYDDNTTVFVNTEAFGVHKEYDHQRGCYVWRNSMGSFICLDKNMKPLEEMDKHVYFTGTNGNPDDPKVSPFSDVRKVWDNKRGCYVWKNIYTGDFLGTDKKSVMEQEKLKQKQQAQTKQNQKTNNKSTKKSNNKSNNKGQSKTQGKKNQSNHNNNAVGKKDQHNNNNSSNQHKQNTNSKKTDQMLITSDEQLRQAEAAVKEAKAQVAAAKAQGVDVNEYGPVDQYIKQAEDAINEYKRKRNLK